MSVIEDALRRAELQGRSTPPQSIAQSAQAAAAVVQWPVLTPSTGASTRGAPQAPHPRRVDVSPAKLVPASLRSADTQATHPSFVAAPRKQQLGVLLIAAVAFLVLGHLLLETLTKYPPRPSIIVAGGVDALTTNPAPTAISLQSMTPDSIAMDSPAMATSDTALSDAAANPIVHRPVPVDTSNAPPPTHARDRSPAVALSATQLVEQSSASAALIESINQRFHVAGVMVSAGKRLAVINDVVVGPGNRIDGAIVRAIDARGAVIVVDGIEHHLPVSARSRIDSGDRAAHLKRTERTE